MGRKTREVSEHIESVLLSGCTCSKKKNPGQGSQDLFAGWDGGSEDLDPI